MNDYIDIANDKARVYEKALFLIVGLSILGGMFISFSLSQEMVLETSEPFRKNSWVSNEVWIVFTVCNNNGYYKYYSWINYDVFYWYV